MRQQETYNCIFNLHISKSESSTYWTVKFMHNLMAQKRNIYITLSTRKMYTVRWINNYLKKHLENQKLILIFMVFFFFLEILEYLLVILYYKFYFIIIIFC